MSFRRPVTVLRESAGTYVAGVWVPGARTVTSTPATVQAVVMGRDLQVLPEGRHLSDMVKIYTADRLNVSTDGEGVQPDIIVQDAYGYELISLSISQSGVINHFKYTAARALKFTTAADWLSGATKRP